MRSLRNLFQICVMPNNLDMRSKASKKSSTNDPLENDTELSDLVGTFQKLQHSLPSTHGPNTT